MNEAMKAAIKFVIERVMDLIPLPKLPDALVAVQPYIAQLLQSDAVLNEDTRMDIQVQIIRILRKAGLHGKDATG